MGRALDRRGSHPEVGSLAHTDPGHQGRREGSHQEGTVLVVGSLAVLVAGAAGLEGRPDATDLVVPITQAKLARAYTAAEKQMAREGGTQKEGNGKYPHGFALLEI